MPHFVYYYPEYYYAECHYAECRYAECRGASETSKDVKDIVEPFVLSRNKFYKIFWFHLQVIKLYTPLADTSALV